jgi:hypothetical protein
MFTQQRATRALALGGVIAALAVPGTVAAMPIDSQRLPAASGERATPPIGPADDAGLDASAIAVGLAGAGLFAGVAVVIRRRRPHTGARG